MDLYRTFPNLPYLTVGRSSPWTPEMVTWTLITVSTDCWLVWGCKVGKLSVSMWFCHFAWSPGRAALSGGSGVCGKCNLFFFLKLKARVQLHCSQKLLQASAKQLPQDSSSVANPPQPSRVVFCSTSLMHEEKRASLQKAEKENETGLKNPSFKTMLKLLRGRRTVPCTLRIWGIGRLIFVLWDSLFCFGGFF